jgi:membrane protein DedA with SNARE-associated domain
MRGLFTFACFIFLLPTIIGTFLWCYLAFALVKFVVDVVGEVTAWVPSNLLQVALLAWLAIMLVRYACKSRLISALI